MIAAGIFTLSGLAVGYVGSAAIASFLLAAVVAAFTALTYCEFSSIYPLSGEGYLYARRTFPPLLAYLVGWCILLGYASSCAFYIASLSTYFNEFVWHMPVAALPGLIFLAALTLLNMKGTKESGAFQIVVTIAKIVLLAWFVVGGLGDFDSAVIADRLMHRVGLQGRSFLPLLSAYACAVPAVMAARTVEDERDRIATIFIAPFMTCSARLPVYALLIAAFIPAEPLLGPFLGMRSAVLIGLYLLGLVAAIGTAALLKGTLLRGRAVPFVMELPPYRLPGLRAIGTRLLERTRIFFRRVGRIILTISVVLWGLAQIPPSPMGGPPDIAESALGQIGQVVEPVIEPLGFDWRIGIGLVASLAAREVIVGTLGTIYGVESDDEETLELQAALQQDLDLGAAVALLIFFVFALQCMSTIAVMRRESGGWKWPILQFIYMLALAWGGAWTANALL